jgi:transcriptional regulator with XRE-family HTH domain
VKKQVNKMFVGTSAVQHDTTKVGLSETRLTPEARRDAFYATKEGPLLAWLLEEAQQQGLEPRQLAERLGVTYGYLAQLRLGLRKTEHISDDFSRMCACFLGVPTITVKLLSGRIKVEDFVVPGSATVRCRREGLQAMRRDPVFGPLLPASLEKLELEVQDAMLALYEEATGREIYGARKLPEIMFYLQRAALIHCSNSGRASSQEDIVNSEDNDAAAA